ncbi:hypothetical protein Y032_0178g650 [Ancylostoma ceylanicum]|uniref:Uncharacterized protein n=1 Tax=Ancylostoma ceylanicum TaxID=53326 RepID=A0A016STD7_9BILA|nr:hypothetical protein Y032_0178g650 [Ancylostoma ceylanicum]
MELSCWSSPKRVKHESHLQVLNFLREIFTKACMDPSDIWKYGVRDSTEIFVLVISLKFGVFREDELISSDETTWNTPEGGK